MQVINSDMRTVIDSGAPLTATLTITEAKVGGQTITINPSEMLLDGLVIRRSSSSGKDFKIGGAEASELTASIINSDGQFDGFTFEGAQVSVAIQIGIDTLNGGRYTVDERPALGELLQIKAFDHIARFMRDYDSTLAYPATMQAVLQDACLKCGVTLDTTAPTNGGYLVQARPEDCTYQEIVRWCAEIAGGFAYCDHTGALVVKSYSSIVDEQITGHYELRRAELDVSVTGVKYETEDEILLAGTDKYTVDVSDNGLITANPADAILLINNVISGLTWRPSASLKTVPLPYIWAGDLLDVIEGASSYRVLVTDHVLNLTKDSETVSAGEPETIKGYATGAPLTPAQRRTISKISRQISQTHTDALQQETINLMETIAGSMGYYKTTVEQPNGTNIFYIHDQPTLEASQVIATVTETGFASTITGWNGGAPSWTYGATFDGSLVMRVISTVGLNAGWITSGQINTNLITIGEETLEDILARQSQQISQLEGGGGNLLLNTNLGTYDNPSTLYWGWTWDGVKKRFASWDDIKNNVASWEALKNND